MLHIDANKCCISLLKKEFPRISTIIYIINFRREENYFINFHNYNYLLSITVILYEDT